MLRIVLFLIVVFSAVSPVAAGPILYWTEIFGASGTGAVRRLNLDGASTIETVKSTNYVREVAIDSNAGKLYATEGSRIIRMNLDGSGFESVLTTLGSASWGLGLDVANQQIYWSDRDTGSVYRAGFDGTGITTLLTVPASFQVRDIDLDLANGALYIADSRFASPGIIWKAAFNGSNLQQFANALGRPYGVDVDPIVGRVFWSDFAEDVIKSSDLNGSDIQTLASGLTTPKGVFVDRAGGKLYWADSGLGRILRSNLDGTSIESVVTGLQDVSGVAVVHVNAIPEPGQLPLFGALLILATRMKRRFRNRSQSGSFD